MTEVHGFGMYGMWGPFTDPGESGFSQRVGKELGINIHDSPYRDYDYPTIAAEINALPDDATILTWGTSLGSNNQTVLATQVTRKIHGAFGFQASLGGMKVPMPKNVLFSHLIYSYNPFNCGLGAYRWVDEEGNYTPHQTRKDLIHPGDYDVASQNMFLAEMRRIIAKPEG
jgi:hypothetical protein